MIIGITGKSSSGKSTIASLLSRIQDIKLITSYTTRPKREGEVDGSDYHFVDETEFFNGRKILLTYISDNDWFYGVSLKEVQEALDKDEDIIIVVNPKGAKELKDRYGSKAFIINLEANDKIRLMRSIQRDEYSKPYEICRRFIKDEQLFNEVNFPTDLRLDTSYTKESVIINVIKKTIFEEA